ncbi:MAG: DUF4962 domain-containing protein [Verrucomicrobia bacterium]|nr:MAG: DUF4962 domain-containing protein [Verrucomicrobiota bacterium]
MMKKLIWRGGLLLIAVNVAWGAAHQPEPTPQLSATELAALEKFSGVHPRLFLTAQKREDLRTAIKTTHANLWVYLKEYADSAVRHGPPKYRAEDEGSGDEQLWQREVGNALPSLALTWELTGDKKYLDAVRAWALASCSYPTWGLGKRDGHDLAAGHQLFGLALVYDWCYADLDAETCRTIRTTLERRGAAMAAVTPARQNFLQNHLWVAACGLAAAGLALHDEFPAARGWVAMTLDKWRHTHTALGPDGASHEGAGYWSYGVEYLLKFMWLAREQLGVNFYDHPWWRNTSDYRLYLALPRQAWSQQNMVVDIADCTRGSWSYGPDYLLRALANEYRNGHAQWLAAELNASGIHGSAAPWLNLIWFDPTLPPRPPNDLPTLRHFTDMDIVSARTDWSGDAALVVFKCGPFIGHKAMQLFARDPGGGHVHPDANHFVVFGNGEWLLRDDGYRTKQTSQHNTLLIDGHGQIGEGEPWFQGGQALAVKARPRILGADATPAFDHLMGDATEAYARANGLKHFVRHLFFLKPNVLIVADDIALDSARLLELRFHPENKTTRAADGAFGCVGKNAALRIEPLTPGGVEVTTGEDAMFGERGKSAPAMFSIRLRNNTAAWRNAVAISWSAAPAQPAKVQLKQQDDHWIFSCAGQTLTLDWATGIAHLSK